MRERKWYRGLGRLVFGLLGNLIAGSTREMFSYSGNAKKICSKNQWTRCGKEVGKDYNTLTSPFWQMFGDTNRLRITRDKLLRQSVTESRQEICFSLLNDLHLSSESEILEDEILPILNNKNNIFCLARSRRPLNREMTKMWIINTRRLYCFVENSFSDSRENLKRCLMNLNVSCGRCHRQTFICDQY